MTCARRFNVSRAGFYSWRQRGPSERDRADVDLGEQIGTLFARSRRTYGSLVCIGRCAGRGTLAAGTGVARIMRLVEGSPGESGVAAGRAPRTATTSSPSRPTGLGSGRHRWQRSNEVWAADITYVPTDEGWLYLAGVLDLGSRRLVGWAMGASLETSLPMAALQMALRQRQPKAGLLHHSDRGCQYASEAYREHLRCLERDTEHEPQRQLLR